MSATILPAETSNYMHTHNSLGLASKAGVCKLFNNAEGYLREECGLSEPVFVLN